MIRFSCPTCQQRLAAAESGAGSKIPCPSCGQRLQVPTPPATADEGAGEQGRVPARYPSPDRGARYVVAAACGVMGIKVLLVILSVLVPVLLVILVYWWQVQTVRSFMP